MRRALLRQAVADNVDVIAGKRPVRPRPPRRRRFALAVSLAAAGLALAGLAWLPTSRAIDASQVPAVTANAASHGSTARLSQPVTAALRSRALELPLANPEPLPSGVFPVAVRRVIIDPGHGGHDEGTALPVGLREKDIALDVALRLRELLADRPHIEAVLTREDDRFVPLAERASLANGARGDLFLSIHVNWIEPRGASGVETFYLGATQDPYVVALAGRENRESGYSLADVRRLLDDIYLDLRQDQSERFAVAVQEALVGSEVGQAEWLRDRGTRAAPFLVLVATEMPAILAEVSCLSHPEEAKRLGDGEYRQGIARALLAGIERYASELSHGDTGGSVEG